MKRELDFLYILFVPAIVYRAVISESFLFIVSSKNEILWKGILLRLMAVWFIRTRYIDMSSWNSSLPKCTDFIIMRS